MGRVRQQALKLNRHAVNTFSLLWLFVSCEMSRAEDEEVRYVRPQIDSFNWRRKGGVGVGGGEGDGGGGGGAAWGGGGGVE